MLLATLHPICKKTQWNESDQGKAAAEIDAVVKIRFFGAGQAASPRPQAWPRVVNGPATLACHSANEATS